MTTQLTTVDPKQFGLEESKADQMKAGLTPIFAEREILAEQYNRVITQELNDATLKEARELRIKIRDNRTKGIEKWHKANKEFYLRGGQFVDAIKKVETAENERMEANLESIEKHFENLEKERQNKLHNERLALITPFVDDTIGLDFRTMGQDVFDAFLTAKKSAFEARIEAEKKAEAERIEAARLEKLNFEREKELAQYAEYTANIVDLNKFDLGTLSIEDYTNIKTKLVEAKNEALKKQEAQRIENERLKKEAEEREIQLMQGRLGRMDLAIKFLKENGYEQDDNGCNAKDYHHFIGMGHYCQLESDNELNLFKESVSAYKSKIEAEKAAKIEADKQAAILAEQAKENARIAAELKAKQDAEIEAENKRKADELKAKKEAEKLAKAPIKKQLQVWVNEINIGQVPQHETALLIQQKFEAFKVWALQQVETI